MTRLLIAGATGLVGKLALEQALADTRVSRITALTRRPLASHDKLENVVIDFSAMPEKADWWTVDGVIIALGTTRAATGSRSGYRTVDHDYPLAVARHARAHGATRLSLTSSLGADPGSRFAYTRTKGELEAAAERLGFSSLTIVRPSVLAGERVDKRFGESIALRLFNVLAPVLPEPLRISPARDVAATLLDGAITAPPGVHVKHNSDMARVSPAS